MDDDSPLSISSNITGILTFLIAVTAAIYARVRYLRNRHTEYLQVKKSLLWFKTESEWLGKLLQPLAGSSRLVGGPRGLEASMYRFVMDDLTVLEQRLLDLVQRIEAASAPDPPPAAAVDEGEGLWATVAQSLWGRPSVTMAWLSSRAEMMELVRQREALTGRVQFVQLSMVSARLAEVERRMGWEQVETDGANLMKTRS
ncbi:hypothetical protein HJFPF1_06976 [Paramyrothecium foliicola]|nr:hypothetical protein HJFPF1_06976 [Paramyrothecium foliicola]